MALSTHKGVSFDLLSNAKRKGPCDWLVDPSIGLGCVSQMFERAGVSPLLSSFLSFCTMASSPGVSSAPSRQGETPPPSSVPTFMPPVTLTSLAPHPYLPLQPSKSQFIIPPPSAATTQAPPRPAADYSGRSSSARPKNILAAAKAGNLEWVERYSAAGQTEMADNMGEVC